MNTNAAHQIPVHRQRRRISRQEMLRRKRAIRRRKRIARFFRISVAVLLLLTAVSFWQNYGGEILPTVNHLYYQLTARYDLPVSKYDFAALQEENETTFAESLSSVDADAENITEALSELVKNNAEAADFVADYPNRQNYLGQSIDLTHDVSIGQVPLFLQWDKRWGYVSFGDSIIGLSGCGPTCPDPGLFSYCFHLRIILRRTDPKPTGHRSTGTSWYRILYNIRFFHNRKPFLLGCRSNPG
jgi:hypothetical protein